MASNSISRPQTSGHPLMPNILKLAEHRSKLNQGKQKMQHELLKGQVHAKKAHADIKRMKAQSEAEEFKVGAQMKLMGAKTKAQKQALTFKQQEREAAKVGRKEDLAFKKEASKQDLQLQRAGKKQELDFQRKSFSLETQRAKLKQKNSGSASSKKGLQGQKKIQPTNRRLPSQQKSRKSSAQLTPKRSQRKAY